MFALSVLQLWQVASVSSTIHPILDDAHMYSVEANLALLDEKMLITSRSLSTGEVVRASKKGEEKWKGSLESTHGTVLVPTWP